MQRLGQRSSPWPPGRHDGADPNTAALVRLQPRHGVAWSANGLPNGGLWTFVAGSSFWVHFSLDPLDSF